MIQGITWDDLIKKGKALAERMGYGAPVTLSTLKAHAKYRDSQKSWKVIKMTKTEVQIEKVKPSTPAIAPLEQGQLGS